MTFQEQLRADITKTFLHDVEKEFSTLHELGDGVNSLVCPMVVYGQGQAALLSGVELRAGHIAIVLATENVPAHHSYGCTLFLDGVPYTVENEPVDDFGMMEVLLRRTY